MAAAMNNNNIAVGVKRCYATIGKGTQCVGHASSHGLCRVHLNSRNTNGPLEFELTQLKLSQKNEKKELAESRRQALGGAGNLGDVYAYYDRLDRILRGKHAQEEHDLRERFKAGPKELRDEQEAAYRRQQEKARRIAEERQARLNEEANQRAREFAARQQAAVNQRFAAAQQRGLQIAAQVLHAAEEQRARDELLALVVQQQELQDAQLVAGGHAWAGAEGIVFAPAQPVVQRDLRDLARDPQSIHTTEVLKHTKEIVAKVRAIPVPEEYRWDREICSKTPGEIIAECKLPQKAAHQMMSQYALDTAIYDIEEGIYGKVLDSMWQFVKGHAEKDSLIAIIREELNAGVGMCAQGNLTRVCNILAGYLDGVGAEESLADKLGRLLPPLREIHNPRERYDAMVRIFEENNVPEDQREVWREAVMDDWSE